MLARASLGDLCDVLAEAYGARVALTLEEPRHDGVRSLSYQDLADLVAGLAGGLVTAGVRRGDRVAVCTANRVDYALTCFAAVRLGAVAVPLHHHLKPVEVVAAAGRARARFLVADASTRPPSAPKGLVVLDALALDDEPVPAVSPRVKPDDDAIILFTSGTSGAPKGATLSSRALLAVARLAALVPDARAQRGVCALPLAHVMGLSTLLCSLMAGAPLHWISRFDAEQVLQRLQEQQATFFVGVPAMYAMLAEAGPERHDLSSVRLFASGADAMPPALVERFRKLGCAVRAPATGRPLLTAAFAEIYGMVELSGPAILKLTPPLPFDDGPVSGPLRRVLTRTHDRLWPTLGARGEQRLARLRGAVRGEAAAEAAHAALGIPIPPYRARIVDDHGRVVRAGVVGELELAGPGVSKGYDGDAEATRRSTQDGWLRTGDLAWKNRLGLIAFATRKKDVIKHGGFSVFPAEVEAQLCEHPAVAEAIVFGVPHQTKGAVPAAAVVLKAQGPGATELELLRWAREHIAPFKAPRSLALVARDAVPRNANRKVLKDELRQQLLHSGALRSDERGG